jgi:hypothetical protein
MLKYKCNTLYDIIALIPTSKNNENDNNNKGGDLFLDLNVFDLKNNVVNTNMVNINISKT